MFIYVASLSDGKFFIGKTKDKENVEHKKCDWTTLYNFIEILEIFEGDGYDEEKTTLKYMYLKGIENVRGGIYSNTRLSFEQYLQIRKSIYGANDRCIACGKLDHSIGNCDTVICYRCGRNDHSFMICDETTHYHNGLLDGCYRCGRSDHTKIRCNRTKDVYGRILKGASGFGQMIDSFVESFFELLPTWHNTRF